MSFGTTNEGCHSCFSCVLLAVSLFLQGHAAESLDVTYEGWKRYMDECQKNMSREPPAKVLVCNRTSDKFSCWPDALPNTTVNLSCPWYLPWYKKVQHGYLFKKCGPDGQWVLGPDGRPWRDDSQCRRDESELQAQEEFARTYESFIIMYTVGYSLSLAALVLALGILVGFRKLHCMRNYIHINLFVSFILRAVSILVKDALVNTQYKKKIDYENKVQVWLSGEAMVGCRTAMVLMQYGIAANYYWLLVEGIYLHNLLVIAVFSEKSYFNIYLCIGWGAPVLFVVPWVIVKYLYENIECWSKNENMGFWWIIRSPILFAILINFFIFIRIIQILVSKLRAHQMRYTDYKFRLAKSTLTLIPLLGIHEVVFVFITEEHAQGTLRCIKLFFELFFNSFQGLLVAILYCFVNKEVQSELLKKWKRWKLGKDIDEEYKHTYSQMPQAKTGSSSNQDKHRLVSSHNNGTGKSKQAPHADPHDNGKNGSSATEQITLSEKLHCYEFPQETAESNF
ncbi:glucagon receptor [Latimeria chalumnae]|uniref:Glucagon receptor n=1 Tax=Latimeria chalumnae TaxID=7897 RepID=H3B540_LATCH|nr:PREDICTED: glucagon receptor [Latimeria chalumnae]XP_014340029.1 PREDICTED: glucagon receptor [Latimeria chalumnae]XP_014340030.1 PREDICTED: glucagon receptor [Latimeria chalumnae]XP_014340031.1 PREDICTED: glucagon receptor [Latimeria chalumnae]XP_014340032.1 PREDICTED: glucagon receptor [Latimeria chalumnae]XP_014340033.1 PREDICTED: glucagon receptor [Latimeria chalumnae]|eukprot:XP_005989135.1 PREDICTED: glucagon receptor [Latimeria chalumnae]